jgi:sugar/nucleoside kinase (ribokinase family)
VSTDRNAESGDATRGRPGPPKVLAIGEILVEIMADEVGDGFRELQRFSGPYPSGAPAIFIDQVARHGVACAIVGAVGDDDFGRVNLDRLRASGVDVSAVRIVPRLATGSAFVRYRADGDRDFLFNIVGSACAQLAPDAATQTVIDAATHLHVMGSSLFSPAVTELTLDAVRRVKARGGTVSFDPNARKEMLATPGMREALERVLADTDLFLPSGPELTLLTRSSDEAGAIAELLERGVQAVVVKRGASGASYHDRADTLSVAPIRVMEVDPTGAGDSFCGTFVAAWLQGAPPGECLRLANASGARAVTVRGPMEGNGSRTDIERLAAAGAFPASASGCAG